VHSKQEQYFFLKRDSRGEEYIESFDEVLILPIDHDGNILFARESAPAFGGEPVLLLPGGTVEPRESMADTANRELQEELGLCAGQLDYLGELRPWSKYLGVRSHVYLGRDLTPSKLQGDEPEAVAMERVPWNAIESLMMSGRLRDARAIAALYRAQLVFNSQHRAQPQQ
jgi:ADP-ribose diphosphatase